MSNTCIYFPDTEHQFGWYQIILHSIRGKCVWTTCQGMPPKMEQEQTQPSVASPRLNHTQCCFTVLWTTQVLICQQHLRACHFGQQSHLQHSALSMLSTSKSQLWHSILDSNLQEEHSMNTCVVVWTMTLLFTRLTQNCARDCIESSSLQL